MFLKMIIVLLFLSTPSLAQTVELASVRVYKYGGTKNEDKNSDKYPEAAGSGWLITKDQVITAYHIINNNREVVVRFVDGYKSWATVEAVDKKYDIALLCISSHATIVPIEIGNRPDNGANVTIHGFGYDYEYRVYNGKLLTHVKPMGPQMVGICEIGPWSFIVGEPPIRGDSGGPVMHNNKVIGSILRIAHSGAIIVDITTILESFKDRIHGELNDE